MPESVQAAPALSTIRLAVGMRVLLGDGVRGDDVAVGLATGVDVADGDGDGEGEGAGVVAVAVGVAVGELTGPR